MITIDRNLGVFILIYFSFCMRLRQKNTNDRNLLRSGVVKHKRKINALFLKKSLI